MSSRQGSCSVILVLSLWQRLGWVVYEAHVQDPIASTRHRVRAAPNHYPVRLCKVFLYVVAFRWL